MKKKEEKRFALLVEKAAEEYAGAIEHFVFSHKLPLYVGTVSRAILAEKAHLNEPWTVVEWDDGTKTKVRCQPGDEYNPLHGLLNCAFRKVGRNRVRVSAWEDVIEALADSICGADECYMLADVLYATGSAIETDGTFERMADYDVRNEPEEAEEPDVVADVSQERLRQMIRNLMDEGEL